MDLGEALIFNTNGFQLNKRYISFDQPAQYVSFQFSMLQLFPVFARSIVAVWDGPNGTGNVLNNDPTQFKFFPGFQLPYNLGQKDLWEFDAGSNIIKSVSIITTPNRFTMDDLIIDSASAPLGGDVDVSSDQDTVNPPQVYLDGDPAFLGSSLGESPVTYLSVTPGTHLVTAYKPGFEWYQEYISIVAGQTSVINASLVPVSNPDFNIEVALEADGVEINGGGSAAPYPADYNDDGLIDLVVGNGTTGNITVYLNIGSNRTPVYDVASRVKFPEIFLT